MQDTETYNGWTNYATWGVALVLDNDESTQTEVRETARAYTEGAELHANVESGIWTPKDAVRFELADWLKDFTERLCGLEDESDHLSLMARQVLQAGLSEVDWDEIARNILDES